MFWILNGKENKEVCAICFEVRNLNEKNKTENYHGMIPSKNDLIDVRNLASDVLTRICTKKMINTYLPSCPRIT